MKSKLISTLMLITLLGTSLTFGVAKPQEVYAAGESKTATLSSVNVSLDGKPAVSVQSYKIDSSNYVRVNEAAKLLNIRATKSVTVGETLLSPESPYDSGELPRLTTQTISVKIIDGNIPYSMKTVKAPCFIYSGDNYYKLSDITAASETALAYKIERAKKRAADPALTENDLPDKSIKTFKMEWDNVNKVAKITTVNTDLIKVFRDTRNGSGFVMNEQQAAVIPTLEMVQQPNHIDRTLPPVEPNAEPQPEMTAPPEVGTQLANILIDKSKGAYNSDKTVNVGNLTEPYKDNSADYVGQCTWYAAGRFKEATGVDIYSRDSNGKSFLTLSGYLSNWAETAKNNSFTGFTGITDAKNIQSRSIAVWDNHAVFVEYVEKDSNGAPAYVYFTEGNTGHDGVYRADKDGKVQKMSFDRFLNRDNRSPLRGYVVSK